MCFFLYELIGLAYVIRVDGKQNMLRSSELMISHCRSDKNVSFADVQYS